MQRFFEVMLLLNITLCDILQERCTLYVVTVVHIFFIGKACILHQTGYMLDYVALNTAYHADLYYVRIHLSCKFSCYVI